MVSEHLFSAPGGDKHIVCFEVEVDFTLHVLVLDHIRLENIPDLFITQDVVVRLLYGQASKQVSLLEIADALFQKEIDHFWVPEAASFVHRIVSKLVC